MASEQRHSRCAPHTSCGPLRSQTIRPRPVLQWRQRTPIRPEYRLTARRPRSRIAQFASAFPDQTQLPSDAYCAVTNGFGGGSALRRAVIFAYLGLGCASVRECPPSERAQRRAMRRRIGATAYTQRNPVPRASPIGSRIQNGTWWTYGPDVHSPRPATASSNPTTRSARPIERAEWRISMPIVLDAGCFSCLAVRPFRW
jgi:hypothetical protein